MKLLLVALALLGLISAAQAWIAQAPTSSGASCVATITGSATGNSILTGSATALANLTCQ